MSPGKATGPLLRLADGLHLLPTDPADVHLWVADDGVTLIDTGAVGARAARAGAAPCPPCSVARELDDGEALARVTGARGGGTTVDVTEQRVAVVAVHRDLAASAALAPSTRRGVLPAPSRTGGEHR